MATLSIGGKQIELPVLNFKTIKKIWPLVQDIQGSEDLIKLMEVASNVISLVLERSATPMTVDEIEDQLLGPEIQPMQKAIEDMMVESGLLERKPGGDIVSGEAKGAAASPSTETGTDSSPSLSPPDAGEETGTE